MMHQGRVILDFNQQDKARLTVRDLIQKFHSAAPDMAVQLSDRLVLA
jgi:ABC-type uncharacterized transport system ATPase component